MSLDVFQVVKEKMLLEALHTYYEKGWSYFGLPELLDGLWRINEIEIYMKENNYPKRSVVKELSGIQQQIRRKIVELKKVIMNFDPQTLDGLPKQIVKHFLDLKDKQLWKEKIQLEALMKYYKEGDEQYQPLAFKKGELKSEEIHTYIEKRGYPPYTQKKDHLAIQQQILKEIAKIEQQQLKFGIDTKRTMTGILIIPSWRKLIGTEIKGFFKQTLVHSIERDSIVIVVDLGRGFQEVTGEDLFLITGPGIYFTEFKLNTELLVRDHREITGIILPSSIYQVMQKSTPIYQSEKIRAAITELAAFIPFSIVLYPYSTQAYLRGVLLRTIFSPYRDVFALLNQYCNTKGAYSADDGLKILSASSIHFNRLLVESKFLLTSKSNEYMHLTAGLADILPGLETIIYELFLPEEVQQILNRITTLKEHYAEYGELIFYNWIPDKQ